MSQRRRRRSRDVALVVVPVLAARVQRLRRDDDVAYCVDQNDQVVENEQLRQRGPQRRQAARSSGTTAAQRGALTRGARVSGGDRVAASNIAENARRGGFGSSGSKSASGIGRSASSGSSGGG